MNAMRALAQAAAERREAGRLEALARAAADREGSPCRDRRGEAQELIARAEAARARAQQLETAGG
jgi:hypothetical protein